MLAMKAFSFSHLFIRAAVPSGYLVAFRAASSEIPINAGNSLDLVLDF